jgi:hypothetical protein
MPEAKRYRKKPVEIEATRWWSNGDHPNDYDNDIIDIDRSTIPGEYQREHNWEGQIVRYYRNPNDSGERVCDHCKRVMDDHGWIDTLEGGHTVCPGDYVITGIKGERYPCKPDIFAATYDVVGPTAQASATNK